MVYVYRQLGKGLQKYSADFPIKLHGIQRIILSGPSGCNFEGFIFVRINSVHVVDNGFSKLFKTLILYIDYRTDSRNTEYGLQIFYGLVKVEIAHCINVNSSLIFSDFKFSLTAFQSIFNLLYQGILK